MKKALFLLMLVLFAASLYAVDISFGPKISMFDGGARGSDWQDYLAVDDGKGTFDLGFGFGGTVSAMFTSSAGVQIDLMYEKVPLGEAGFDSSIPDDYMFLMKTNVISIPLNLRLNFPVSETLGVYILAGPTFDIFFGKVKWQYTDSDGTVEGKDKLSDVYDKTFLIGLGGTVGVNLPAGPGALDIGLNYTTHLNQSVKDDKTYMQNIGLELAYMLSL